MNYELPQIGPSDDIVFDGEVLRFDRQWDDGTLSLTRLRVGRPFRLEDGSPPCVEWFLTQMAEGRLHLKTPEMAKRTAVTGPQLDPSDPAHREARLVQFVLQTIDASGCAVSNGAIAAVLEDAFTPEVVVRYGPRPSASTARKWLSRGSMHRRTLEACRSSRGRTTRSGKLDDEVQMLRTDAALHYWSAREAKIEDAHAEHVAWVVKLNGDRRAQGLDSVAACSIEWLRVRINELETYETYEAKFGKKAADARFAANGLGTRSSQILELGIIDHQNFDSFCAIDEINGDLLPVGRPTVTAVYDDFSACIVAAVVHVTPPSLFNMLDAIKHANRPKMRRTAVAAEKHALLASIYGRFDTILPDNAWEFVGSSGQDNLHDLGCSIDWARAGRPKDKAKLERFWGSLTSYLSSKLPGAVFDPKLMRELGYDPTKEQAVLLSDIRDLLAEAVAYYHTQVHTGVNAQPARLWEKGVRQRGAIPVIRDDQEIDRIMGMVVETTLTTSGVRLFGRLWYTDLAQVPAMLNRMAGTSPKGRARRRATSARVRVKAKFNPADLTILQVYDHVLGDYVALRCREEYVEGLSLKHHEVVEGWTKVQNLAFNTPEERKIARATLNRRIREAAPHVAMRHRKKFAALVAGGAGGEGVGVAHAPSSYSGMAPVIGHVTALRTRTDDGRVPPGPPRGKGKVRVKMKEVNTAAPPLPAPETGRPASFGSPPAQVAKRGSGDWGGLS